MKLWACIQWGNPSEGGNGDDTQVLVRAETFERAVALAEDCFKHTRWNEGKVSRVVLLGEDAGNGVEEVVNPVWRAVAIFRGNYPDWMWEINENGDYSWQHWKLHEKSKE